MTSSTRQFTWKDRDTAAHDMLQLVYHAPPYISRLAARLIASLRSIQVMHQLSQIVLDAKRDRWIRIYALRAYVDLPGDHLATEFHPLAQLILSSCEDRLKRGGKSHIYPAATQSDLLLELASLAEKHPSNRPWFFESMRMAHPLIVARFIGEILIYLDTEEFRFQLVKYLMEILDDHPEFLDLSFVSSLTWIDHEEVWVWLEKRFEAVLTISLDDLQSRRLKHIARRWPRLSEALTAHADDWNPEYRGQIRNLAPLRGKRTNQKSYLDSPAYRFLRGLYEKAKDSQEDAYQQLLSIGRRWRSNIPASAVATHLIGQLSEHYDVYPFLASQVRYADVDWENDLFDSPIRFEAGEALLKFPTPETWEVFVDSYFIKPRDDFLPVQAEWIAYLTDILSGKDSAYERIHFSIVERRPWFKELVKIPVEDLNQL